MENGLLDQPMISYWKYSHLILLPPEIEVGSKSKCEYFQYEIIG